MPLFPAGFVASKVPENLDAVIIGSGVGGLGLAVLLAKVGKKVLVLEQHDRAGGCCHTFKEKGFEFDVGEALWISVNVPSEKYMAATRASYGALILLRLFQESTISATCWITSPSAACWTS